MEFRLAFLIEHDELAIDHDVWQLDHFSGYFGKRGEQIIAAPRE